MTWTNAGSQNNGDLWSVTQQNGGPGYPSSLTFTQTYGYDGVNRLTSASDTGGWSRSFNYDAYGNMWVPGGWTGIAPSGITPTSDVYNAQNRINTGAYDAAGNQTLVNSNTLTYDAEGRQTQEVNSPQAGGGQVNYFYDGDGRRVMTQVSGTSTTIYVYTAAGQMAAEYHSAASTPPCGTCYLSSDHLGTTRLVTDAWANVVARHDFLPFGEEIAASTAGRLSEWGGTEVNQKFTGKERDQETGLDYFGARFYGSALGRFTSPDPGSIGAEPSDPQSWNAYVYAGNNPLSQTDPDGLDYHVCVNDQNGNQQCTNVANDQAFQQAAKNPGAGLSVSGDNGSGAIFSTDANGNKVQVGTYQHFVGPGTEGGGLQQDYGTELAVAGLGARVMDAGAGLVQGLAGAFGRRAGTAAAEDAALAAGNAFRSGVTDVLQRAGSVVGNQQARVASEDVAKQAAEEFLGPGSREITQQYGNRAGQAVGRISADGQRVVRVDTNAAMPHYNFVNKTTSGNLHVYF